MTRHRELSLTLEELIQRGYRKTSNKYRMVSRIDRPDWVHHLARHLNGRSVAEFYDDSGTPSGQWCDYYRRVLSEDSIESVPEEIFKKIPSSVHQKDAYIPLPGDKPATYIDLDEVAMRRIKDSILKSKWLPEEYTFDLVLSDICRFLEEGPAAFME